MPKSYTENTLVALYNDEKSVEELFEKYGDKIACVVVEPVAANMGVVLPKKGFLQFLRDITEKYGSLLIFDEVITGFRLSLGGAQEYFGIKPDMTTLGKIVGGGMPMAVYGGRKEIMDCVAPLGGVYQAGTLSGNPIATTAGIATLTALKENKHLYADLEKKAEKIANSYRKIGASVNQIGSLLSGFFTDREVNDYDSATSSDTARYAKFFNYLLENGIYIAPSQYEAMFVSMAHSDEDIEKTCKVIESYKG